MEVKDIILKNMNSFTNKNKYFDRISIYPQDRFLESMKKMQNLKNKQLEYPIADDQNTSIYMLFDKY